MRICVLRVVPIYGRPIVDFVLGIYDGPRLTVMLTYANSSTISISIFSNYTLQNILFKF